MRLDVRYLVPGMQVPTGPDTDALVAEYIFEIPLIHAAGGTKILAKPRRDGSIYVLPYSQEEWAAMHILKHAHDRGWGCFLVRDTRGIKGRVGWWECNMTGDVPSAEHPEGVQLDAHREAFAYQPTLHQVLVQGALIRLAREAAGAGELEAFDGRTEA